jgi:hypothetical protein
MSRKLDVVYVVKPSETNEELRYSLRSLENLPHGQVFVAGYMPSWLKNCLHIPNSQNGQKYENTGSNITAACRDDRVSDDFILMNDDFFVLNQLDGAPPFLHMGGIDKNIEHFRRRRLDGPYWQRMKATKEMLNKIGISDVICYETHVPYVMNKQKSLDLVEIRRAHLPEFSSYQRKTFYCNYYSVGGREITDGVEGLSDVKIESLEQRFSPDWTFVSTSPEMFLAHPVGEFIRRKFLAKSIYEK